MLPDDETAETLFPEIVFSAISKISGVEALALFIPPPLSAKAVQTLSVLSNSTWAILFFEKKNALGIQEGGKLMYKPFEVPT